MRSPLRSVPSTAVLVAALAASAVGQNPTARDLADRASRIAATLHEADSPQLTTEQKQARADAKELLAALVKEAAESTRWSEQHYVEASSPLITEQAAAALAISEAGTKRFAKSRFLWDHVGFAHTKIALDHWPGAAQVASLRAGEQAFRTALELTPDTMHAHLGLFQVLDDLNEIDGALQQLDIAMKDTEAKVALPAPWLHRASLLLRSPKPKEALIEIGAANTNDGPLFPAILRLRVHALTKDAAATDAAITALLAQENSPHTNLEVADALFYLGRKADAAKALAKLPPIGKFETDEERVAQQYAQSGAALAAYWSASDVSAKGGLRAAWTKALGHHFLLMDGTAKPKAKETDLSGSPRAMAVLLQGAMKANGADIKNWANVPLLVLCVQASADYKPQGFEATMIDKIDKDPVKADDFPGLALAARRALGDPDASCVLSGLHAMERIAPLPKKPPATK